MPRKIVPMFIRAAMAAVLLLLPVLWGCGEQAAAPVVAGGNPERGRAAIERYGCVACHTVPGIPAYGANVGPPLVNMAQRGYIGGVLPNTLDDLVRWLRDPPAVDPLTAMPNVGLSHAEATDIAAYLYAH
jgi:cytochrome c